MNCLKIITMFVTIFWVIGNAHASVLTPDDHQSLLRIAKYIAAVDVPLDNGDGGSKGNFRLACGLQINDGQQLVNVIALHSLNLIKLSYKIKDSADESKVLDDIVDEFGNFQNSLEQEKKTINSASRQCTFFPDILNASDKLYVAYSDFGNVLAKISQKASNRTMPRSN